MHQVRRVVLPCWSKRLDFIPATRRQISGLYVTNNAIPKEAVSKVPSFTPSQLQGVSGTHNHVLILASRAFASHLGQEKPFLSDLVNKLFRNVPHIENPTSTVLVVDGVTNLVSGEGLGIATDGFSFMTSSTPELGILETELVEGSIPHVDLAFTISHSGKTRLKIPAANTLFDSGEHFTFFSTSWKLEDGLLKPVNRSRLASASIQCEPGLDTSRILSYSVPLTEPRKVVASLGNVVRQLVDPFKQDDPFPSAQELTESLDICLTWLSKSALEETFQGLNGTYALVMSPQVFESTKDTGNNFLTSANSKQTLSDILQDCETSFLQATAVPRSRFLNHYDLYDKLKKGATLFRVSGGGGQWKGADRLTLESIKGFEAPKPLLDGPIFDKNGRLSFPETQQMAPAGSFIQFLAILNPRQPGLLSASTLAELVNIGCVPYEALASVNHSVSANTEHDFALHRFGAVTTQGYGLDWDNQSPECDTTVNIPFSFVEYALNPSKEIHPMSDPNQTIDDTKGEKALPSSPTYSRNGLQRKSNTEMSEVGTKLDFQKPGMEFLRFHPHRDSFPAKDTKITWVASKTPRALVSPTPAPRSEVEFVSIAQLPMYQSKRLEGLDSALSQLKIFDTKQSQAKPGNKASSPKPISIRKERNSMRSSDTTAERIISFSSVASSWSLEPDKLSAVSNLQTGSVELTEPNIGLSSVASPPMLKPNNLGAISKVQNGNATLVNRIKEKSKKFLGPLRSSQRSQSAKRAKSRRSLKIKKPYKLLTAYFAPGPVMIHSSAESSSSQTQVKARHSVKASFRRIHSPIEPNDLMTPDIPTLKIRKSSRSKVTVFKTLGFQNLRPTDQSGLKNKSKKKFYKTPIVDNTAEGNIVRSYLSHHPPPVRLIADPLVEKKARKRSRKRSKMISSTHFREIPLIGNYGEGGIVRGYLSRFPLPVRLFPDSLIQKLKTSGPRFASYFDIFRKVQVNRTKLPLVRQQRPRLDPDNLFNPDESLVNFPRLRRRRIAASRRYELNLYSRLLKQAEDTSEGLMAAVEKVGKARRTLLSKSENDFEKEDLFYAVHSKLYRDHSGLNDTLDNAIPNARLDDESIAFGILDGANDTSLGTQLSQNSLSSVNEHTRQRSQLLHRIEEAITKKSGASKEHNNELWHYLSVRPSFWGNAERRNRRRPRARDSQLHSAGDESDRLADLPWRLVNHDNPFAKIEEGEIRRRQTMARSPLYSVKQALEEAREGPQGEDAVNKRMDERLGALDDFSKMLTEADKLRMVLQQGASKASPGSTTSRRERSVLAMFVARTPRYERKLLRKKRISGGDPSQRLKDLSKQ